LTLLNHSFQAIILAASKRNNLYHNQPAINIKIILALTHDWSWLKFHKQQHFILKEGTFFVASTTVVCIHRAQTIFAKNMLKMTFKVISKHPA